MAGPGSMPVSTFHGTYENPHFSSKFNFNTIFELSKEIQIQFWHSQRSPGALNFENLCLNTHFLVQKSDISAHFESFFDLLRTLI